MDLMVYMKEGIQARITILNKWFSMLLKVGSNHYVASDGLKGEDSSERP
jgi:hypothetical protein